MYKVWLHSVVIAFAFGIADFIELFSENHLPIDMFRRRFSLTIRA